jgi:hypothetical protein
MSSIVPLKISNSIYLYLSTSFTNAKGKPYTKRKCIGHIDNDTKVIIFNKFYNEYMSNNWIDQAIETEKIKHKILNNPKFSYIYGKNSSDIDTSNIDSVDTDIETNIDINSIIDEFKISKQEYKFTNYDISNSKCRILGLTYFLNCIAKEIGLITVLQDVFPDKYEQLLTIAYFLIATNDSYLYCSDWIDKNITNVESNELSSQRISDLINTITFNDRINFYSCWNKLR